MTTTVTRKRKAKDPERTRADILQAALEVFAERGFDGATIRDIAARIGMSHGMIRYHYEAKEKLWFAAVAFLFDRLNREVSMSHKDTMQLAAGDLSVFRSWLRTYVHYCAKHPEHARIMMQESVAPTNRLSTVIEQYVAEGHRGAFNIIETMKRQGVFPKHIPAASIIYMISGACQNVFALAPEVDMALGYKALEPSAIEAHADGVVAIFCPEP